MLSENIIAFDALESEKHRVKDLTSAIIETGNQNLKQTLLQMRDQAEQSQEEMYHIAEQNGWYLAADKASQQQISRVTNFFAQTYQNPQQEPQMQQPAYNQGTQMSQQTTYQRSPGSSGYQSTGMNQSETQSGYGQNNYQSNYNPNY